MVPLEPKGKNWVGAHGVEFDAAIATQYVIVAVEKTCLVATFSQCTCATVPGIEHGDMASTELLHQTAVGTTRRRCPQQAAQLHA